MPLRPILLVLLSALVVLAVAPPASQASRSTVRVGIADQAPAMFASADYRALQQQRTRYFIKWNAIDDPATLRSADAFVSAARAAGVDVLLHFSTDDYTPRKAKLPSVSNYSRKVGALVDRYYAMGVREYGAWNEANDRTQPTYRSPTRAADFFKALWGILDDRDHCGAGVTRKCRVVALDLLDGSTAAQYGNVRSYVRRFYGRLSSTYDRRGRFVGIHNYSDTNRHGKAGTKNIIDAVRHANHHDPTFWMTETGGIVKLGSSGDFTCNPSSASSVKRAESRANRAVSWMFSLAKTYRTYVDRLYVYQWTGSDCAASERFDAGLVRRGGGHRGSFVTLRRQVRDSSILKP